MVLGKGSTTATLTTEDVQQLLASAYGDLLVGAGLDPAHKRVLVIIPDGTRTAPVPLMFRLLYEQLGRRVAQLDYVIALGTHPPMSQKAIDQLVGATAEYFLDRAGLVGVVLRRRCAMGVDVVDVLRAFLSVGQCESHRPCVAVG